MLENKGHLILGLDWAGLSQTIVISFRFPSFQEYMTTLQEKTLGTNAPDMSGFFRMWQGMISAKYN